MSSVIKSVMAAQTAPNPGTEAIRIRYIDSLLTNIIAQLIGALPPELQVPSGDASKLKEMLDAIRAAINAFLPTIFFLDFSEKHTNFALYMDMAVTVVAACAWALGAAVAGGGDRFSAAIADVSSPVSLIRPLRAVMDSVP